MEGTTNERIDYVMNVLQEALEVVLEERDEDINNILEVVLPRLKQFVR